MMKFGIILPNYGSESSVAGITTIATQAESLAFDSIWTTDHILLPKDDAARFGQLFEAITTLCTLAGLTNRIRLGISSLVLPQRNPILVAKQLATLDSFSNGRALLCAGVGWSAGEYKNLGMTFQDRGRRMDEAIHLLRTLWSTARDESVDFSGTHYQFKESVFSPLPVQVGGPPLWIGGNSKAAIRRAAKLGDGWHPSSLSLETFSNLAPEYLRMRTSEEATLSARLRLSFDNTDPSAQLLGSAEEVVNTLQGYKNAGLRYAVISLPGESTNQQVEAMHQFSLQVVPHFKEER